MSASLWSFVHFVKPGTCRSDNPNAESETLRKQGCQNAPRAREAHRRSRGIREFDASQNSSERIGSIDGMCRGRLSKSCSTDIAKRNLECLLMFAPCHVARARACQGLETNFLSRALAMCCLRRPVVASLFLGPSRVEGVGTRMGCWPFRELS